MLEIEGRAAELWNQIRADHPPGTPVGNILNQLAQGYAERTPSGGIHFLYRCATIQGNTKLASNPNGDTLIETRGEGGYTILSPSHGTTHPSGKPWVRRQGDYTTIPDLTPHQRQTLHNALRNYNQQPDNVTPLRPQPQTETIWQQFKPDSGWIDQTIHDFNQATTWQQILVGWTPTHTDPNGITYWTRPGKNPREGHSATTNALGTDRLIIFTSSAPPGFQPWTGHGPATSYNRFDAYTILNHGGDRIAAARALREQGYGPADNRSSAAAAADFPIEGDELDGHGWEALPLTDDILDGTWQPPDPDYGRINGVNKGLIYAGRVNGLHGESGCGKSWVALHITHEQITQGHHTIYIDLEDHPASIINRLRHLGATPTHIRNHLSYIKPARLYTPEAAQYLTDHITQHNTHLVVIDSVGEAMALQGQKQNDDDEVVTWFRILPRHLARTGAAILLIDHIPKSKEANTLFAIGSQRKKAAIDGASYRVEQTKPMGVGLAGEARLTTAKDRNGAHPTNMPAATFVLDAETEGGRITSCLTAPKDAGGTLMAALSSWVIQQNGKGEHPSQNELTVKNTGDQVIDAHGRVKRKLALDRLIADGHLERTADGFVSVKRYDPDTNWIDHDA